MIESLKFEKLDYSDIPDWDEKIISSKQGTVFNTLAWADVIKNVFGHKNCIFCITKNNNIIGALPVHYKSRYGMKVITQVPITQYLGTLFFLNDEIKNQKHDQYLLEIHDIIIRELKKEFKFCDLTLHPSINDIRPFQWNGWQIKPQYSYHIHLNEPETMNNNLSSSLRRKLTHAMNDNLVFKEEPDIEKLVQLHEESYARKGMNIIVNKNILSNYIKAARDKNLVKIFSIYDEKGRICSSRAALLWNNTVYDWIAGTGTELKEKNATHLLLWKILEKYSREGYRLFDFMGANTKNIIDFKKSFGGNLIPYYEVKYFSSRWLKILNSLNEFRHRLKR